jgi:hypothetical protein
MSTITDKFEISGTFTIQDIKYDLLKIIEPYDGYMYNDKDTSYLRHLFISYLNDLRKAYKLREFNVSNTNKDNAVTFDIEVRIHKDRSPKKLKIHVGKLVHFRDFETA